MLYLKVSGRYILDTLSNLNFKIPLRKLRRIRRELRVTQSMVAERLNVTTQFYSQIERGVNVLSYSNAIKIAKYFNTTPDELFKEEFLTRHAVIKTLIKKAP